MAVLSFLTHKLFGDKQDTAREEIVEMKPVLTDSAFILLRDLIYKTYGIYYKDDKKGLLEDRIGAKLIEMKLKTFESYIDYISETTDQDELNQLVDTITINETYFYRDIQQYDVIEKIVIPELIRHKSFEKEPVVRIWSSAASTGEEAYTLAIIILERLNKLYPNVKFQILASDINQKAIDTAKAGTYSEYSVRNIPSEILDKYFTKAPTHYLLSKEVKDLVRLATINLYEEESIEKIRNCDIILCRNLLIYFDHSSREKTLSGLFNSLNKGGYLFVGYAESLHGLSHKFKLMHLPKAMAYRKE